MKHRGQAVGPDFHTVRPGGGPGASDRPSTADTRLAWVAPVLHEKSLVSFALEGSGEFDDLQGPSSNCC